MKKNKNAPSKTLEQEYEDLLKSLRDSRDKNLPKIQKLLNKSFELKNKAFLLAEECGIGVQYPESQEVYISTKIKNKTQEMCKKEHEATGDNIYDIQYDLDDMLNNDFYDIFGFDRTHPFGWKLNGHWIPSVEDC